ncbi:Repressor ROX1 [Trametes pubescens]|uniref:Repressor ROX1 n=1 Tax=Trametes pubescens TaxID=154538 RepID=A0A1M2W0A8_TRAPU|nr:Repressor ROX1 [Trametes pubescens]
MAPRQPTIVLDHTAPTADTPFDSDINGWQSSSLASALGGAAASQAISPREWHNSSDPLLLPPSLPSPSPSLPFAPSSPSVSSSSPSPYSRAGKTAKAPAKATATTRKQSSTAASRQKAATACRRSAKAANHISRPRNAFIIFRSHIREKMKLANVENDNRIISKISGKLWGKLSEHEKAHWASRAEVEKREHAAKYPDYVFKPVKRAVPAKSRHVSRNGVEDEMRNEKIVDLIIEGKDGDAFKAEVERFDLATGTPGLQHTEYGIVDSKDYQMGVYDPRTWNEDSPSPAPSCSTVSSSTYSSQVSSPGFSSPGFSSQVSSPAFSSSSHSTSLHPDSPVFRSPLLPPSAAYTPALSSPLDMPDVGNFPLVSAMQTTATNFSSVSLPYFPSNYYPASASLGLEMQPQSHSEEFGFGQLHISSSATIMHTEPQYMPTYTPPIPASVDASCYPTTRYATRLPTFPQHPPFAVTSMGEYWQQDQSAGQCQPQYAPELDGNGELQWVPRQVGGQMGGEHQWTGPWQPQTPPRPEPQTNPSGWMEYR